jgi:hypothetical protein
MPIKELQSRLTQVGVIRLGQQLISRNNKPYPSKLETLRFTSPSRPLIEAVANLYGGEVKAWKAPSGPQWEVITGVKEISVLVPPQRIDPNLEHWGNGFRDRMCDGETESIRNAACLCAAARAAGQRWKATDFCKPTTRMSVMLADIPSLGTWKIESHGWNAAAELPTLAASIESAPQPIPARLEVQIREKKDFDPSKPQDKQIESKVFGVPVLHFDWLTPAQAFGGELGAAARAALGSAAVQRQAIEAAKVESSRRKFMPDEYITLADDAKNIEQVRALWSDAAHDEALTDEVKARLQERVDEIKAENAKTTAETPRQDPQATPTSRVDDVVDAEVAPNPDEVWSQIQTVAGAKKWNADDLERRVQEQLNKSSDMADGFELTRFLEAVKNGEIQ